MPSYTYGTGPTGAKNTRPPNIGGTIVSGGTGLGSAFKNLTANFLSKAPNAPIKPAKVALPNRSDWGAPATAPTLTDPSRKDYGQPSKAGLRESAKAAGDALKGFNDPRHTKIFQDLMGAAGEQTARQVGERQRNAADAAQRGGGVGGFEDSAREADRDRMLALAETGFKSAETVRAGEASMYGASMGEFTKLQTAYNQAKSTGDIAFAHDLTMTHMQDAENKIKTMGLNMDQQKSFAQGLNDAKQLQAQLDQAFNNSLIDNNRYIEGQQQIAAQMAAQMAALEEKRYEFDKQQEFDKNALDWKSSEHDKDLLANTNTALPLRDELRPKGPGSKPLKPGQSFQGLHF